jgi:hypothetical protein
VILIRQGICLCERRNLYGGRGEKNVESAVRTTFTQTFIQRARSVINRFRARIRFLHICAVKLYRNPAYFPRLTQGFISAAARFYSVGSELSSAA